MEFNKQVSNPLLVGAIALVKAEDSAEHNQMLIQEIMKANYVTLVSLEPNPQEDEEGKITVAAGTQMHFPMLKSPDGKHFFAAFTDRAEIEKWKREEKSHLIAMKFHDYVDLVFRQTQESGQAVPSGFVINPFGENLVVPKQMMEKILQLCKEAGQEMFQ